MAEDVDGQVGALEHRADGQAGDEAVGWGERREDLLLSQQASTLLSETRQVIWKAGVGRPVLRVGGRLGLDALCSG